MTSQGGTKLVADVALFRGDRALLVKYRDTRKYDGETGWFLPDDYLRRLEHPEDAGIRILREQVGMELPQLDLGFIESFEGNGHWHLVFHLVGRIGEDIEATTAGNTIAARWFGVTSLPTRSEVAHDGWAINVLEALSRSPESARHIKSLVD